MQFILTFILPLATIISESSGRIDFSGAKVHSPAGLYQNCTIAAVSNNENPLLGYLVALLSDQETTRGTVTDIDGNIYPTLIIGNQEWMAENLRVTHDANGNLITRYCYNNNITNCELYGGLYTWNTVIKGQSGSNYNPSGVQGICPTGWHVPSHHEWTQLEQYICNALGNTNCETTFLYDHTTLGWTGTDEGNALKSCRQVGSPGDDECDTSEHPRWNAHGTHYGFDEFGFSAHSGGLRWPNRKYTFVGVLGYWWTATEYSLTSAWYRAMSQHLGNIYRHSFNKNVGFSLRCVRIITEEPTTHSLQLNLQPEGAGNVTGAGEYTAGTMVSITAVANDGWEFSAWEGDTDHVDDTLSVNVSVIMPDYDISLVAKFNKAGVSDHLFLSYDTISHGNTYCFDALQTISVYNFTIEAGGSATLIAGKSINLMPGTTILQGGNLHARIAAHEYDYCDISPTMEISNDTITTKEDLVSADFLYEVRKNSFFSIYPNPTDGSFTLELTASELPQTITVDIYAMFGGLLFSQKLPAQRLHTLSLEGQHPGMYIIRITKGDQIGVERLIKR